MMYPIFIGILWGLFTSFLSFFYYKYVLRSALLKQGIYLIAHYLFILVLVAVFFFIRRSLHLLQITDQKSYLFALSCWVPFLAFWIIYMYRMSLKIKLSQPNPPER